MQMVALLVNCLAGVYPWEVETSDDLIESLSFIDSPYRPETVVRAGYGAGVVVLIASILPLLATVPTHLSVMTALVLSLIAIHAVHATPHLLAAFRRTKALGDTPNLVGRAVLRMQIQPATENAVRFAADTGSGPLADSLSAHVDRAMGTPRSGLLSFADEWSDRFPALRRSAHLLVTAQDAPPGERARTLDRSLAAILDGTRNQMAAFTTSIRGPTTALYAFGVMLPLALVALVPAATLAGYPVSIWFFVGTYNVLLPVVLLSASVWLLVCRPVAFPPPTVSTDHPDVPDRLWRRALWGGLVGAGAYLVVDVVGPSGLAPIAGLGVGLGVALLVVYHPILAVRNYVRAVEAHLVDALYLVGRQVAEGEAVESSIEQAGERVPGDTGGVFERAAGVQRRLHLGVEEAFLGEYGALRTVPSSRARGTAALLAIASEEGQPAGRAIVSMADHLEELQGVESETQRQLATVTETLDNTAAYFGPLVAGATVGLAGLMVGEGVDAADATTLPTDSLSVVVGLYVITLCFILTPLSIALRYGLDRALIGYYVGRSLVFAVPLYVVSVGATSMIM